MLCLIPYALCQAAMPDMIPPGVNYYKSFHSGMIRCSALFAHRKEWKLNQFLGQSDFDSQIKVPFQGIFESLGWWDVDHIKLCGL